MFLYCCLLFTIFIYTVVSSTQRATGEIPVQAEVDGEQRGDHRAGPQRRRHAQVQNVGGQRQVDARHVQPQLEHQVVSRQFVF